MKRKKEAKVPVSEATADALDAWATAFKRYMAMNEKLTDSCISLAKDCRAFAGQLVRPAPKLVYGCAALMNGCADIGSWLVDVVDLLRLATIDSTAKIRNNLDAAGVPTVEQATDMLDAAMKKAPEG